MGPYFKLRRSLVHYIIPLFFYFCVISGAHAQQSRETDLRIQFLQSRVSADPDSATEYNRLAAAYLQKAKDTPLDPYEMLTTREREVLHLAAQGYSNADIAARLSISPYTAMTHRSNLMGKLGLHTPTDLIRYALQRGLIAMEE